MPTVEAFPLLLPLVLTCAGALACLACEPFLGARGKHGVLPWLGFLGVLAALVAQILLLGHDGHLAGLVAFDAARGWLAITILAAAALGLGALQQSLTRDAYPGGEPYALLLFATCGGLVMVMAADTVALFVGLELASLPIYALVGLRRHRREANEALFKYFIMGAVFSAVFLYGAALTYGATGSTRYGAGLLEGRKALLLIGHALMVVGLLFKIGAVPFHFWSPDAYTGAPAAVTGFMGAAVKVAGIAALGALWLNLVSALSGHPVAGAPLALNAGVTVTAAAQETLERFHLAFLVLALLSLVLGNFAALRQTSARRLIAYSAVAHAGYMLLAFALPSANQTFTLSALWFYAVGYGIGTAGALAALSAISGADDTGDDLNGLAGQGRAHPFHGMVATVFLVSIAGIPPTVGFLGKYLVFGDLVAKGKWSIALFGMVMAVVGAAYYLRLVVALWSGTRSEERTVPARALPAWTLGAAAIASIALMLAPEALRAPAVPATAAAAAPAAPPVVAAP